MVLGTAKAVKPLTKQRTHALKTVKTLCSIALLALTSLSLTLGSLPIAHADAAPAKVMASTALWMSSAEYQSYFDHMLRQGYYPTYVEGRCDAGRNQYRAVFSPYDRTFGFEARHGLPSEQYYALNAQLLA